MLHRGLLPPVPSGLAQDPGGKGHVMALDAELLFPLAPELSAYLISTPKGKASRGGNQEMLLWSPKKA